MKNVSKVIIAVAVVTLLIVIFTSWTDVDPGSEGFIYRPYDSGIDTTQIYAEGSTMIAPWNEMITYNIRQQSRTYTSEVMDKQGTPITILVAVNFHAQKGKTPLLHLKHGPGYVDNYVDKKVRGAIKDVIGRYTYTEVYSSRREALEQEIEHILAADFEGNFVLLDFVEIADINLPEAITKEITNREQMILKQQTSYAAIIDKQNQAQARFEEARGDSALLISASYKAAAIELESRALKSNPEYTELKKWEKWNGQGSPYGTGNVFGSGVGILKTSN